MFDVDAWPQVWASVITVVLFGGILIGTWWLRREVIFEDAPDQNSWRDLRIWATVLIFIQFCIYYVFT